MKRIGDAVSDFARDWPLHIVTTILVGVVALRFPQQAWLLVYKAALILCAAVGAYWINRLLFNRKMHCGDVHEQWQATAIICAAMLAAGLAA